MILLTRLWLWFIVVVVETLSQLSGQCEVILKSLATRPQVFLDDEDVLMKRSDL